MKGSAVITKDFIPDIIYYNDEKEKKELQMREQNLLKGIINFYIMFRESALIEDLQPIILDLEVHCTVFSYLRGGVFIFSWWRCVHIVNTILVYDIDLALHQFGEYFHPAELIHCLR
jgi:hypothetical protein